MITGSPTFTSFDNSLVSYNNDRKLSVAQILASNRKVSVPNQYRPTTTPPASPHSPHLRKPDSPTKFRFPAISDNATTSKCRKNSDFDVFSTLDVRSPPMTLHEAIGDVGLGGEFERRLALREVLRQLYEDEERERWSNNTTNNEKNNKHNINNYLTSPIHAQQKRNKKMKREASFEQKYFDFLVYAAVHHGYALSVLLFLPLILMVCYIVFVERSPIFT